jgi:hypothetical protein
MACIMCLTLPFPQTGPYCASASQICTYTYIRYEKMWGGWGDIDNTYISTREQGVHDISTHIIETKGDILYHDHYNEVNVNEQKAIDCVPDSLYMFLNLMLSGPQLLEVDVEEVQNDTINESLKQYRILSSGQDIVYSVSREKQMTPKQLRLGSALHQATRSKKLAQLFHNAGNAVS